MINNKRQRGFTLIELMIVVAIIGILAGIAYPIYQKSVYKSRRSDAQAALTSAAQQLERCFIRKNDYSKCDENIPKKSEGGFYKIDVSYPKDVDYKLTATAQNGQQKDTDCKEMTLNGQGKKGPDACW